MVKTLRFVSIFAALSGILLAQSSGQPAKPAKAMTQVLKGAPKTARGESTIDNILTIVGNQTTGVPCTDCVTGVTDPTLGLPEPLGTVLAGSTYQIDSYLVNNSFTGSCTFTMAIVDHGKHVVASTTQTLPETAGTNILLTADLTVALTSEVGVGKVYTTAECGTSKTKSQRPLAILSCVTKPPHCAN